MCSKQATSVPSSRYKARFSNFSGIKLTGVRNKMAARLLLFCIFFVLAGTGFAGPKSDTAQTILDIVDDPNAYNKNIIPGNSRSGPLKVESTMYIRNLEVDDVNMRLHVDLTFRMYWDDSRLSYSVAGVPNVRFWDVSKFWIPDAFFKDSFLTEQMKTIHPESYIEVATKERILYSTRLRLSLKCVMEFKRFPHDVQSCPIRIASYGYSTKDVIFTFKPQNAIQISQDTVLPDRFNFRNMTTSDCSQKTETGYYSCLELRLDIGREFSPYFLEWYMPCLSYVAVAFLSELLAPSHILPRIVLTVLPLITITASSMMYSKQLLPQVRDVTALGVFTSVSAFAIFLTLLHAVLSYYFFGQAEDAGAKQVNPEVAAAKGKWNKLYGHMKARPDGVAKILIAAFYIVFVFAYLLTYCLS